jgi:hypothetical protein
LTANNTDSIEEFRVVLNGGKAEYGRNAGAQVEWITRSGANDFHGNLFDYHRNTVLNANNWFNNSSGVLRPKFIQNFFGGSAGGLQTFDIARNDPRSLGIDAEIRKIIALLPNPNDFDIGDGLNSAGFRFNNSNNSFENQWTMKIDHNLWDGRRVFYRHSYDRVIGAVSNAVDGATPGFSQNSLTFPNSAAGSDVRLAAGVPTPAQPGRPVLQQPNDRQTSIYAFDPNLRTGYFHHFNLNIQIEVMRNTVMDIGYVGTRGIKLFTWLDMNQPRIYGDFLNSFREIQAFRATGATVPASNTLVRLFGSPAAAVTSIGASTFDQGLVGAAANTVDRSNYTRYRAAGVSDFYLRNFPQYNLLRHGDNNGHSYYNSLQASIRRQTGALKFQFNYTFSRSIDNTSVDGNGFTAPIDNYNFSLNRGLSDFDIPHVLNGSVIYTLPVGRGKSFGSGMPGWADSMIGGWDIGLLTLWQAGRTMTITSGRTTGPSTSNTWANYSGDRTIGTVDKRGNGVYYFSPDQIARFSFPGAGEVGTSGRNAFRGPSYINFDASIVKRFRIWEQHSVTFRAEMYNMLNHPTFGSPGLNLVTPASFGRISAVSGAARIMQMALRYDF